MTNTKILYEIIAEEFLKEMHMERDQFETGADLTSDPSRAVEAEVEALTDALVARMDAYLNRVGVSLDHIEAPENFVYYKKATNQFRQVAEMIVGHLMRGK